MDSLKCAILIFCFSAALAAREPGKGTCARAMTPGFALGTDDVNTSSTLHDAVQRSANVSLHVAEAEIQTDTTQFSEAEEEQRRKVRQPLRPSSRSKARYSQIQTCLTMTLS